VFDQARHRYNEAALVARKHPELDAYIRRSAGKAINGDDMPARDTVLQRAVDMIQSSGFLEGNKIDWITKPRPRGNASGANEAPPRAIPVSRHD
jgi:hypothetical protein